jgi:hypothetical protein
MAPAQKTDGWGGARTLVTLATVGWLGVTAGCTGMVDGPRTAGELAAALRYEVPAAPDALLAKFDRTVFYSDSGSHAFMPRSRLEKWERPIEVVIVGTLSTAHRQFVETHFAELTRLTGLPVTLQKGSGSIREAVTSLDHRKANFLVAIDSRGGLDRLQAAMGASAGERWANRHVVCFFYASPRAGRIVEAFAAIPTESKEDTLRHCIIEETTQALGLFADADVIQPSMFSERTPPILGQLTLNDKIILRTLYDPRITPNMQRDKALKVAQQVIAELIAAVGRDGLEALYQRPASPSLEASRPRATPGA